jgi:peptidoglycan/xylan/chitin deacetylase (PgdA/CDA1 family)
MKNQSYLTISIDDGHLTDLRAAELLQKLGLKATFYIPARNQERELMSTAQIRQIAANFEVGSHSLNHRPLTSLPKQEAELEINSGKKWLEDLIGQEVIAFCYPQGKFHSGTIELVKQAGFLGARTCMFNLSSFPINPFLWGVSTHAYSHSIAIQIRHALLEKNFQGISNFVFIHKLAQDWPKHFSYAVDFVEKYGGVAHLYFHSWEIEELNQWNKLENVLGSISKRHKLMRVTNGKLFQLWHTSQSIV